MLGRVTQLTGGSCWLQVVHAVRREAPAAGDPGLRRRVEVLRDLPRDRGDQPQGHKHHLCGTPLLPAISAFSKPPDRCLYVLADLNSMFDFAAYNLHGEMMKLEAAGKPAFLRDDRGEVVILCNVRYYPPPAAAWQQVPATPDA